MLTLAFTAATYSDDLALSFSETADSFAMNPDPVHAKQVSNFVYTFAQTGAAKIDIYGSPVVTVTLGAAPYYVGTPIPFSVKIDNQINNGGSYAGLNLAFTLPAGSVLEYCATLATCVPANLTFVVGTLIPDDILTFQFQVTLSNLGSNDIIVALENGATLLDSGSATVTIEGNFNVTGTFAMEGRTMRGGIPVTFTKDTYSVNVITFDQLVNNFSATLLYNGTYTITTNQPRYLNVTTDLAKKVVVPRAFPLTALTLRGGNVTDVDASLNKVDLADATMIGLAYDGSGNPLDLPADANFDGKVNIQDLAMVGGNFDLTAEDAYSTTWTP